jgi:hypothetical protein
MLDNIGNGKMSEDQTLENESKTVEPSTEQKEAQPKDAYFGVDGQGYVICKIHSSQHPLMVIGFLHDCISNYRGMIIKKQKDIQAQKEKLMGGSRRFFNLLKPK